MLVYMGSAKSADLAGMPRGGPDASWLDRILQTDRPEYLDRDDVSPDVKRGVIDTLERLGALVREHQRNACVVLEELAGVADPRILELGAGHGALSRVLLEEHPSAHVTASDVDPGAVAMMADSELGRHPRATVRQIDAGAIDAADGTFDIAVFALSFHHLPPPMAARVLAEATRVAGTLVVIDLARPPSLLHLVKLATMAPLAPVWPFAHDGLVSSLRAYSPSALRALAEHAGAEVDFRPGGFDRQIAVFRSLRPRR
jgi:SAM-dependent methyltransferase